MNFRENFVTDISLDNEVAINAGHHPDPVSDRICLDRGLCTLSALGPCSILCAEQATAEQV